MEDKKEEELNQALDVTLNNAPVPLSEEAVSKAILAANTRQELMNQFDLFNLEQSRKNALRVIKLNGLLEKVEDQAIQRFEKHPDQISNKELLDYMQVVSTQIDHATQSVNQLVETPAITPKNQTNVVNINVGDNLNRDSKEKVVDAVQKLLAQLTEAAEKTPSEPVYNNDTPEEKPVVYFEQIDEENNNE